MLNEIKKELKDAGNPEQVELLKRYFKTGKGEYGEGDIFLGMKSQTTKDIAKKYYYLELREIRELLKSKIHEERTAALRILDYKYKKAKDKKEIFEFYLNNTNGINNWDLVDVSAPNIVGDYLLDKDRKVLYKLAKSENLWERRIAIISTLAFIRKGQFEDTLRISEMLLGDKQDLMHKAVGWMLREVGKKDKRILERFLEKNYKKMPRTTLRYAIEKFPEDERKGWLRRD